MSEIIGKFCSVAKKNTIIIPKDIPGYKTPEGQVLKEDGQKLRFIYTEIPYKISYKLNGGKCDDYLPTSYTVRSHDIIPPKPEREDYHFTGWEPEMIPHGSIGDVTFTAKWEANAILLPGKKLCKTLASLAGGKENIMAIEYVSELPVGDYANISATTTPILASFDMGIIKIWAPSDIYCNMNMRAAFIGFTILRDISALRNFICKENTDITALFKDCAMLSDVSAVSEWGNSGHFKSFDDAFTNTQALACMRVPTWYKWNVKINYESSTGTKLDEVVSDRIPGETVFSKMISGYKAVNETIKITSPTEEYTFVYDPIQYKISYELNGGEIYNEKTSYTIEDETYYPPEPVKSGMKFTKWIPECIEHGEYGNASFIANFEPNIE